MFEIGEGRAAVMFCFIDLCEELFISSRHSAPFQVLTGVSSSMWFSPTIPSQSEAALRLQ